MSNPATSADRSSTRRVEGQPRVTVTQRLLPATEARMGELFHARFSTSDRPMSRDELTAAMQDADVLTPPSPTGSTPR